MPDPPPDLNDAQYVALIFEHACNVCYFHRIPPLVDGSLYTIGVRGKGGVVQDPVAESTVVQEV